MTPALNAQTVGGQVTKEFNMNGVADTAVHHVDQYNETTIMRYAEPGLSGIKVIAYDDNGIKIDSTTTDASGNWTINVSSATGSKVLVEFVASSGLSFGPTGADNQSSIVVAEKGNNSLNLTLGIPSQHSQNDPDMVISCFVQNSFGSTANDVLVSLNYAGDRVHKFTRRPGTQTTQYFMRPSWVPTGTAIAGVEDPSLKPSASVIAGKNDVGTVFGLAWDKINKVMYSASFYRHQSVFLPNSDGKIYTTTPTGTNATWVDLSALGISVGTNRQFNNVGHYGLGDIEIAPDGSELYVVNLFTRQIHVLPIGPGGAAPTSLAQIRTYNMPVPAGCAGSWNDPGGNVRPYMAPLGIGVFEGKVYFTQTCTGPLKSNLRGFVHSFDPADPPATAVITEEMQVDLSQDKAYRTANGFMDSPRSATPWEYQTVFDLNVFDTKHHPWLGDIEFDLLPSGDWGMILATRNRQHDILSTSTRVNAGVLYRACRNTSGTWTLEGTGTNAEGTCGTLVTGNDLTQSSFAEGNADFFDIIGGEGAMSAGTIACLPGFAEVAGMATDNIWSLTNSGIAFWNCLDGTRTRDVLLLGTLAGSELEFYKANNWGDIEIMCEAAPLEIGNLVWIDNNKNGIQDPSDAPVYGATVNLYLDANGNGQVDPAESTPVATTKTDIFGHYYFSSTDDNVQYFTDYIVAVDNPNDFVFGGVLVNALPAIANATADNRDFDGQVVSGKVQIDFNTGGPGATDHSYDFAFDPLTASLGDYVWLDEDKDGSQDPGIEVGMAGITVTLFNNLNEPVATTKTDAYGYYLFEKVIPGTYTVGFTPPINYKFTTKFTGNAIRSDVNPGTGLTDPITLVEGESNLDAADAGFVLTDKKVNGLGNFVWLDLDKDGLQDPNEYGVAGVTVTLYNSGGTPIATTVTNNKGYYQFLDLTPTQYSVGITLPIGTKFTNQDVGFDNGLDSDVDPATGRSANIFVPAEFIRDDLDIGIYATSFNTVSLGDNVFNDLNQNGLQDANEPGLPGVTVILYAPNGTTELRRTTSDAYGDYVFTDLNPGNYVVGILAPAGFSISPNGVGSDESIDSDILPGTGKSNPITLLFSQHNPNVDAGLYESTPAGTASIGDYLWHDYDKNGIQDPDEVGASGVMVVLYDINGNVVETTVSDENGFYSFVNLPSGTYSVGFENIPSGYVFTKQDVGANDARDSDVNAAGRSAEFVLSSGQSKSDLDAGIHPDPVPSATATIGDKVFLDLDNDGIQDAEELGAAGITVTLYEADGVTVIATTTTNALGEYIFNDLDDGDYVIGFSNLPGGYVFSPQYQGGDETKDSDADTSTGKSDVFSVGPGADNVGVDAGIFNPAATGSIDGFAWNDADKDGLQGTGEDGVAGISVSLYDLAGNLITSTTTDENGKYSFQGLPDGNYRVGFGNLPDGFILTDVNANPTLGSDADPGSGITPVINIAGGANITDVDAGIYGNVAALGSKVWDDINKDGQQDPSEPGVPGVTVVLYNSMGTALTTTITDDNGEYRFVNLEPGTYSIGFGSLPGGVAFSPQDQASGNDDLDSDIDPATGLSSPVVLAAGDINNDLDAGIFSPDKSALGNFVWLDDDQDGIQDNGEVGFPGVTITLYDNANNPIASTISNGEGFYYFEDLPVDGYFLEFDAPAGFLYSPQNNGGDENDSDVNPGTGITSLITLVPGGVNMTSDAGLYRDPTFPVELLDFNVHLVGRDASIDWVTENETNNAKFIVQRSADGAFFTNIGDVLGAGTSASLQEYNLMDPDVLGLNSPILYYRLKQMDFDGEFTYSNIVKLNIANDPNYLRVDVFPNPVTDGNLSIKLSSVDSRNLTLCVVNTNGKLMMKKNLDGVAGAKVLDFNVDGWAAGVYFVQLFNEKNTSVFKFVVK